MLRKKTHKRAGWFAIPHERLLQVIEDYPEHPKDEVMLVGSLDTEDGQAASYYHAFLSGCGEWAWNELHYDTTSRERQLTNRAWGLTYMTRLVVNVLEEDEEDMTYMSPWPFTLEEVITGCPRLIQVPMDAICLQVGLAILKIEDETHATKDFLDSRVLFDMRAAQGVLDAFHLLHYKTLLEEHQICTTIEPKNLVRWKRKT